MSLITKQYARCRDISGPNSQSGFTLLDLMLTATILSLLAVAVTLSSITASRTSNSILRSSVAFQLAQSKLEELAAISPQSLDNSYDVIELSIKSQGHEFSRQVDITVNADGSRDAVVTVRSLRSDSAPVVQLAHTFALWGAQ